MATTLSPITASIPSFTVTPQVNSTTFPEDIDQYNVEMPSVISQQQALTTQINKLLPQLNSLENNVANLEASTISASAATLAATNFKGTWSSATSYTVPSSVSLNGKVYMSLLPSTNQTPPNATYWYLIPSIDDVTPSTLSSYSSSKTKGLVDALATAIANIPSVASATHSVTSKETPVNDDEIGIADSVSSFSLKKLTWANLKATLKTYFDGIYQSALGFTPLQQGGGIGQLTSKVIIGWTGYNLKATVGGADIGCFLFDGGTSMTINGYQQLSSGFLIQWGTLPDMVNGPEYRITFPIAFPNYCASVNTLAVQPNYDGDRGAMVLSGRTTPIDNYGFYIRSELKSGRYMAIGF